MSYSITPSADGKFIVIVIEGSVTRRNAMEWIVEANALGRQLGIRRYLVDVTKARNTDAVIENYEFAYEDMQKPEGIDRWARIATLAAPEDDSHNFVATVAANAGLNFKLFKDTEQAMRFLLDEDTPRHEDSPRELTHPSEPEE